MSHVRTVLLFAALFAVSSAVSAQRCYTLVERTDLRRYDNNTYTGLVSREVRSIIRSSEAPAKLSAPADYNPTDTWYDGFFYITEQTKRQMSDAATGIHDSIPAVFRIQTNGHLVMYEDHGYPSFRSFPSFPKGTLTPGTYWTATAERAVDPLNKGTVTHLPMEVSYSFIREEQYHGETVYRLTAKWATRYGTLYTDPNGDPDLKSATGSHHANILISKATKNTVFIQDLANETFDYKDNHSVSFKGTISQFTEYPPAVPRGKLVPALKRIAELLPNQVARRPETNDKKDAYTAGNTTNTNNNTVKTEGQTQSAYAGSIKQAVVASADAADPEKITVEDTSAGLRLSIQNLQFRPDSAELLPGERIRLDKIAEALKLAPNAQLLVEGHTASIGKEAGELQLSKDRAHSIASELVKRGIPADKFICRGWGARKPVAGNSTEEGRARNRRVEITIIE